MEKFQARPAGSRSRTRSAILAATAFMLASCSSGPSQGSELTLGSDTFHFCADWKDNTSLSFGLIALESNTQVLTEFSARLVEPNNLVMDEAQVVRQGPNDNAGSFGYLGNFEDQMSLWSERKPVTSLTLRPGETWMLYLTATPVHEGDRATAEEVRVEYTDENGERKFQISHIGFGMSKSEPCFPSEDAS